MDSILWWSAVEEALFFSPARSGQLFQLPGPEPPQPIIASSFTFDDGRYAGATFGGGRSLALWCDMSGPGRLV